MIMDTEGNYPTLKEYPLQSSFSKLIPTKAQKGLSTYDVEFTCLDADGSYLVIGSNVGVAYLIDREKDHLHRLKDNEHKSPVSSVRLLVSLECLVAVGYRNGTVLVYKIPFQENQELEKFTVEGLHSSSITALEWAKNGMKYFSGDENGIVVCTDIDHFEHQSRSRVLVNEKSKVVQLSYSHLNLVISTSFRSLIYSFQTNTANQIGQKERKCFGPFGAIIFNDECRTVYASRPGQRLWKSDICGVIYETMIFKNVLSESCPVIETLTKTEETPIFTDFQFERLVQYGSYILIWSDVYIVLIDPEQKMVVAASQKLDPVIDVATCGSEIFILRGLRHILRISNEPDKYSTNEAFSEEPSLFEEILEPLKGLSTYVKERSDSLSVQTESNSNIFDWLKKKRSSSSPAEIPADINCPDEMKTSDFLPAIVSLNSNDCIPVKIDEFLPSLKNIPEFVTKDFSKGNDNDDVVFKVKKKHKKNKKVQFAIDAAPTRANRYIETSESSHTPEANNHSNKNANSEMQSSLNNEANVQSVSTSIQNHSETDSASSAAIINTEEKAKLDNIALNICENTNKINSKTNIDTDKLLENVLSAYSNFKHKDSLTNALNANLPGTNLKVLDIENENCSDEESHDLVQHNSLAQDVNENIVNSDSSDQESTEVDTEELYSSLLYAKSETKEITKSEGSVESLEESSLSSMESKFNEPPKYGVDWVEYKAPELLLDISVSSDHIFCVDVRNQMYFSRHPQMGSLRWIELEQPAEKIAASHSETVVWALYRGTVYSAHHKALCLWKNTEWMSIAREVISIAVDDECGWYAKSNGELVTQQNLALTQPTNYPVTVPCNSPALQVSIKDGVLWVLTISGSLLARKASDGKRSKSVWKEVKLKSVPGIDSIFLGSKKTGWIVDSNGMIYFIIGVTPEFPEGTGEPWLVEASSYLFRSAKPLEQVVRRALNSETLTNLIRGKQHLCLAASDVGVWFCKTYDNLLYSNQKSIIGHNWEKVIPQSTSVSTKWRIIAADGINNSEGGLWCLNSTGELFCYDIKLKRLLPVELPSGSGVRCLQPKYQSLWLLSENGSVYVRRGITNNCLQGMWWQALNLTQFGSQQIIHISCSSFVSWACSSEGEVFMRLGSLSPSSTKLSQAWLSIGIGNDQISSPLDKLSAIGKHFPLPLIPTHFSQDGFCQVYVGPQGYPVWAIDKKRNVYVREGVTTNLPIGEKWTFIPDLQAATLCISNNAVWLLKSSGKIFRRFGVTEKNPCGDYWKQMPGNLNMLSTTEDDDLWGLQNGSIYCHYSFVLSSIDNFLKKTSPQRTISEDDWEDIMAEDFEVL